MSFGKSYQNRPSRSGFLWPILAVLVLIGVALWWQLRSRGPPRWNPKSWALLLSRPFRYNRLSAKLSPCLEFCTRIES